ncbi:oligopeptide transporter subunit; ATP-binding component of ABC superfamily [Acetoanaerobium sticklandii]|uniref:Oligopeptide transporter subunit ATP-binding component of ABC superfamily n=1 Tax=Acetoanaerobium sticklandii (strain ATCC 12662 / DSM 519 / JCM 1433 / CCUG 9281 / NCIMB 10654 / HF) TaxID=499177 RepID=E3PR86_ACESD|nr:ABC transporter ATP-binding protein [Acetoanaerobium sticklandii]CBH20216.1 oligopeptide transporter subunit; ATP-binding component of ABC superfamily [Acetoanaerobium sticklandii]
MNNEYLLEVKNISKKFSSDKNTNPAVKNLNFSLKKGEVFSIVGESGCGKTTTGRIILRLIEADSGEIWFKGKEIRTISKKELKNLRPSMQIIFQDPYGSLNPRMNVKKLLYEAISSDKDLSKEELKKKTESLVKSVGLSVDDLKKYPHEFSGGQRQRIGIARAIATEPDLIVCDEPVSALDLLVQAQILNLLKKMQKDNQYSYIFISHDLSVVKHMSDRVAIMYLGQIVEVGTNQEIFDTPIHPYTKLLLDSVLNLEANCSFDLNTEYQDINMSDYDENSCCFYHRCPYKDSNCNNYKNEYQKITNTHYVACKKYNLLKI